MLFDKLSVFVSRISPPLPRISVTLNLQLGHTCTYCLIQVANYKETGMKIRRLHLLMFLDFISQLTQVLISLMRTRAVSLSFICYRVLKSPVDHV